MEHRTEMSKITYAVVLDGMRRHAAAVNSGTAPPRLGLRLAHAQEVLSALAGRRTAADGTAYSTAEQVFAAHPEASADTLGMFTELHTSGGPTPTLYRVVVEIPDADGWSTVSRFVSAQRSDRGASDVAAEIGAETGVGRRWRVRVWRTGLDVDETTPADGTAQSR